MYIYHSSKSTLVFLPHITASLFSSESSNLLAFVEEGSGSQLSQSLSDVSGNAPGNELSSSPRKQSGRHGNITSLVSPYSHGASRKGSSSEKTTSSLSRLQDTGIFSSSFSASFSRESTPISPTSPLIVESPSHQYIVTGSATSGGHHSDDSIHGNDSGGVQHFHFPSANPESPAETEGSHGNNTPVNTSHPSDVKNKMDDVLLSIAGEGGGEGRSEEGVVTLESQRRKELSEKMKMSVERGLGEIMALIVEEGRPQVVGGEEEGGNEEEEGEGGKQEQTEMVLEMRGREEEQEGEGREEEQEGEGREEEQEGEGREEEQEGEGREEEQEGEGREEEQEGEGREEDEEMEKEKEDEKERESMEEERERPVEAEEAEKEKEQENKEQVEIEETNEQKDEPMDEGRESITVVTLDSSPRPVAMAIAASPTHQESSIVVSPVHKTTASVLFAPQPNRGEDGVKENEKVGEGKKKARETVKALEKVGDEQKEGGAWINLSDQFQSAMNIIDSFSATMEQDFGTGPAPSAATNRTPTSGIGMKSEKSSQIMSKTKPKATPYTPDNKKPEYLVSPNRRKKLVEQAAKRFPFKRAHTFDVGASHTPSPVGHTHPTKSHTPSSSPAQSRAKWAEQDLVSQTRKQRLMNDALAKMRHRFSQSTTAAKDTC